MAQLTASAFPLIIAFLFAFNVLRIRAEDSFPAGPIFDHFPLTLSPGSRTEAAGPLFYLEHEEEKTVWALPPLFSSTCDPTLEYRELDLLYPLLTYDKFGEEFRIQIFQLLSFSGGGNVEGTNRSRFTVFPFYFQQRSPDSRYNYTALFPVYGKLKNRLFKDEINFVLFPLYAQTRKKEVRTYNYVYPLFHLRYGDGLFGWQLWPIAGNETKAITTRTNDFGDLETVPGHKKLFILWPIFFEQQLALGTTNLQRNHVLFPLYALQRSPQRDSSTWLWPLFTYTDDREKKYQEWGAPWPFIMMARGEGKTAARIWPLFGHAKNKTLRSDFVLWPIYKYNSLNAPPAQRARTRIGLFLYSDIQQKNMETGAVARRRDQWPLFTWKRELDGNERLQVFSLLEPLLPNNKSIERNYSPLWSVWRSEKNPKTGASSQSLLWNLYRRQKHEDSVKTSLLFGLFQKRSREKSTEWRLFYFPVGKGPAKIPADRVDSH